MEITNLSQLDMDGIYTYADYLTWQVKERLELLKGKISLMYPAGVNHNKYSKG
ncbi:MAG: hypothetical protein AAGC85_17120 [Bacteroidota bacterium]